MYMNVLLAYVYIIRVSGTHGVQKRIPNPELLHGVGA